jgi:hypothetical protein
VVLDGAAGPLDKAQEEEVAKRQDADAEEQLRADAKILHALAFPLRVTSIRQASRAWQFP